MIETVHAWRPVKQVEQSWSVDIGPKESLESGGNSEGEVSVLKGVRFTVLQIESFWEGVRYEADLSREKQHKF